MLYIISTSCFSRSADKILSAFSISALSVSISWLFDFSVILCERGIRTFETMTRNTLDINAVVVAKQVSHLPVIVDPSHGTGQWKWVSGAAKAGVAAGCDGLMIEVHDNPEKAFSDGSQSLMPVKFEKLMQDLQRVAQAVSREI